MKRVSIVGFGRFGKVFYKLIKDDFLITLYDVKNISKNNLSKNSKIAKNLKEVYKSEVIFYAVPIDSFSKVISSHKKYFRSDHLLIDLLSVKIHPSVIFNKYLKNKTTEAILLHPMFGPDSAKKSFNGLPIIIDKFKSGKTNYKFWVNYFTSKNLSVIQMSAINHDKLAANSQGLTHFIGRLVDSFGMESTLIDSLGAKKLIEVKTQTCNDSWQLFTNLQHYNPYTKSMRIKIGSTYDKLYNKLLPKKADPNFLTFGIQGGRGSFNEEAIFYFLNRSGITKFKIKYLFTAKNVLRALHAGLIDFAQVAIHNSVGGVVDESIYAMARYKFKIVEQFAIKISHALIIRNDANLTDVKTILTHPQVLAQCKNNLSKKYPSIQLKSGKGDLIDHALVAKKLSENKLPKNIATLGSSNLAKIYNLKIVEENLQDSKENFTSFLQLKRI